MRHSLLTGSTAIALALGAWSHDATPVHAQQAEQMVGGQGQIDVATFGEAYDEIRQGWTAEWMMDQPVYGAQGEDVGEVDQIFINRDGEVSAIVVEAGGFWDIGDTHLRIPWDRVELGAGGRIVVAVDEDDVPNFDLFNFDDEEGPGPRSFRASELIGDYVRLEDDQSYGYVSDVVFNDQGEVQAVIINPSYTYGARYGRPYGYYAYPYYGYGTGYGFAPGREYYNMPYTGDEIAELEPFDYQGMEFGGYEREAEMGGEEVEVEVEGG